MGVGRVEWMVGVDVWVGSWRWVIGNSPDSSAVSSVSDRNRLNPQDKLR